MQHHSTPSSVKIPALTAALAYAARGWQVIPLHDVTQGHCSCVKGLQCGKNTGKHPRLDDWTTQGSTDPTQIRQWWQEWPTANVGIVTGLASGIGVLDTDPRNGGDVALEAFLEQHGPLPETPMALTGSIGGTHRFFTISEDLPGCKPAPGLDLQLSGQQVVAAPSVTTRAYCWEASAEPDDVPLAPLPTWLLDIARAKAAAKASGVDMPDTLPVVTIPELKVSARIKYLIQMGEDPDNLSRYPSRSEAGFAVIQALIRAGHDHGTIAAVLLDTRFGISTYIWDRKNPKSAFYVEQTRRWVAKEIGRALAKPLPDRTVPDMTQPPVTDDAPWPEMATAPGGPAPRGLLHQRRVNIARYRAQIQRDPYFGAPERRGTGITPALLLTQKAPHHD